MLTLLRSSSLLINFFVSPKCTVIVLVRINMPGLLLYVIVESRDSYHGLLNIKIKANGCLPLVYWLSLFTEFFFGA